MIALRAGAEISPMETGLAFSLSSCASTSSCTWTVATHEIADAANAADSRQCHFAMGPPLASLEATHTPGQFERGGISEIDAA
jgi:hypothetical protein